MLTLFDRQWRYMPKTNPQPACNICESCVATDQCCPREQHSTDAYAICFWRTIQRLNSNLINLWPIDHERRLLLHPPATSRHFK